MKFEEEIIQKQVNIRFFGSLTWNLTTCSEIPLLIVIHTVSA